LQALADPAGDLFGDDDVDRERQVRPVRFGRADGQQCDAPREASAFTFGQASCRA